MSTVYLNNPLQGTGLGLNMQQNMQTVLGQANYYPAPTPYPLPPRNPLSERCAMALFRFNGKFTLSDLAKEMPGDYDLNRKVMSDIFLLSHCSLTLEQAASLAFVLREEVGSFIETCDQAGMLVPSGE